MSTWIPLHANVYSNPKVTRAARRLTRGDVEKLVGHLGRLWTWAADHAESGDLSHLGARAIGTAAGWNADPNRFVTVLLEVGLFDAGPTIHKFDRYAGRLVARRKSDRERKEAARKEAAKQAETGDLSAEDKLSGEREGSERRLSGEREGYVAARNAEKQAETRDLSAGSPAAQDRTGQDRTKTTTTSADAVRGTGVSDADSSRSSDGIGRSQEADVAHVERALDVLRRVRWYPLAESQDRSLLEDAARRAPGQNLAADVLRWVAKAEGGNDVRRPRGALTKWLLKFGDHDGVVDRPPSADLAAAELAFNLDQNPETWRALKRLRGVA